MTNKTETRYTPSEDLSTGTLRGLLYTMISEAVAGQESIESSGQYRSPFFEPLVRLRGQTDAGDEEILAEAEEIFAHDPTVPVEYRDSNGVEADGVYWLQKAVEIVKPWSRDPYKVACSTNHDAGIFSIEAGKVRHRVASQVTHIFLKMADSAPNRSRFAAGERQLAAEIGVSRQCVHSALDLILSWGILKKVEKHVFVSPGNPMNRVSEYMLQTEYFDDAQWKYIREELGLFKNTIDSVVPRDSIEGNKEKDIVRNTERQQTDADLGLAWILEQAQETRDGPD